MMGRVQIAQETDKGSTAVSNLFIDAYMADANDAQLKIYFYLLRVLQSGAVTTVAAIADKFNHTEREVRRALKYWEERGLLVLEYDDKKRLTHICLEDPQETIQEKAAPGVALSGSVPAGEPPGTRTSLSPDDRAIDVPAHRAYDAAQMAAFAEDPELSMALFAAEHYFHRALNSTETQTILYIYQELRFSPELLDYLLQYTAENARGRFSRYMETTALAWREEGVQTVADARKKSGRRDKRVYEIMRALGLSNTPTDFETAYFERWLNEYAFSMEIILEACKRCVFQTQTHRIEYTDGILKRWHAEGVATTQDILRLEEAHEAEKAARKKDSVSSAQEGGAVAIDTKNRFNRFRANDYDFDEIKKRIVSNR